MFKKNYEFLRLNNIYGKEHKKKYVDNVSRNHDGR